MIEWEQKDELIILRKERKILTRPIRSRTQNKKAWRRWRRGVIGILTLDDPDPCCAPRGWKHRQQGMIGIMQSAATTNRIAGKGSNLVISHTGSGADVVAGARFQQDGFIDDLGPFAQQVQIAPNEWWNNEKDAAGNPGDDFDIRAVSMTAGTWDDEPAAVGVFINIGTGRNWREIRTFGKGQEGPGTDNANSPMEIRHDFETIHVGGFNLECSATLT